MAFTKEFLEKQSVKLDAKLAECRDNKRIAREEARVEKVGGDPLDVVVGENFRHIAVVNLDACAKIENSIYLAKTAIKNGSYGICEECEEPIKQKRLEAVPWARFCIGCQETIDAAPPVDEVKSKPLFPYGSDLADLVVSHSKFGVSYSTRQ